MTGNPTAMHVSGSPRAFRADDCSYLIDSLFKCIVGYDVVELVSILHLKEPRCFLKLMAQKFTTN
jgi:hypothetical protein